MSEQQTIQDQVLTAVDELVSEGTFVLKPDGTFEIPNPEKILGDLEDRREERKAAEVSADDSSDQERLILGFTLHGDKNNTAIWAKFRQAIGLGPGDLVPHTLWSEPEHDRLAQEIDAIFRGQRDVRTLNGRTLIDSYRLRVERDQATGSVQALSQAVAELSNEAGSFVENDMLIAIEILQSTRARSVLKQANHELENALRRDRNVEQVVRRLLERVDDAKRLVAGRLGDDMEFDTFEDSRESLRQVMTEQKSLPISTNIVALDMDMQGGVQPTDAGKLLVLAARTGVGKTTIGIAAAMGLTLNGGRTLFLSSELSGREISARALGHYASQRGFPGCRSWVLEGRSRRREVAQGFDEMLNLYTLENQEGKIGDFTSRGMFHASAEDMVDAMYAAKSRDPQLSAVFIDHFHALRPSKGYNNRSTEMEARILFLYQAAKSCKVDLFLMAQLNREATNYEKPSVEHINGTDAIAQLATAVWMLEFDKNAENFNPNVLSLWHGKFRNGQRIGDDFCNFQQSILQVNREYNAVEGEHHI